MAETITAETVRHIAKLARIELDDGQVETFARQLGSIIEYFDKLQQLDTEGVEPLAHPIELRNVFADDVPGESLTPDQALANAPQREGDYFRVPRVIGEGS